LIDDDLNGKARDEKMIDPIYFKVLHKIYTQLNNSTVNWVVTGSLGFALQGVPIEVHDIDIQTDRAGIYKIEQLFSEFVIKKVSFSSAERIRSHFGVLMIDGIKVDIMGDIQKKIEDGTWETSVDLKQQKRFGDVEGMHVPVLSLEYEYHAYLKLGRTETAEKLRKWLEGQT